MSSAGCCPPRARKCRARERAERCLRIMASQVTCRELHAKNVKLYKVTHGVCTLLEYNSAHKDDLDGTDSLQHAEWRALYTQFQADHVLGTVPYRWEKGHAEAVLIEATLASVDIVEIDGPILHDGSVSGGEKAAAVKEKLGLPEAEPLMEALGRLGKTALVRETEDEWELGTTPRTDSPWPMKTCAWAEEGEREK